MLLSKCKRAFKVNCDLRLPLKDHILQKFKVRFEDKEFQAEGAEHATQKNSSRSCWDLILMSYGVPTIWTRPRSV